MDYKSSKIKHKSIIAIFERREKELSGYGICGIGNLKLFRTLSLTEKEDLLKKLSEMTEADRRAPKKSYLEEAWASIQREIASLARYSYVDEQLEIDEIWNICEEIIKVGKLRMNRGNRKLILAEIIKGEYFDYYSVSDPMMDLMTALCLTPEEELLCADLIFEIGSDYMKRDGAKIYKKNGKMDKYYQYTEQHLGSKKAPYMELIEHYRNSDPDRAVKVAELGLKSCKDDQTDIIIFLLQYAQQMGDKEKYAKLLKGARFRRTVDFAKVQEQLGL